MGKDDEERAMRLQRRNVQKQIINNDQMEIINNQREVEKDAHPEGGVKEIPKSNIIADETTMNSSEIFCYEAMYPEADADIQDPLLAYKAVSDPDTMYLHQALKEDDKDEFIKAMRKEIHDQSENGNFSVIHKSQVPEVKNALPVVWQMKRKRDIRTREIKKYKARLNIDGSRMKPGRDYSETYALVASWRSVQLLLT